MAGAVVAVALAAAGWVPGTQAADRFADGRNGSVSWAVRTEHGLWGRGLDRRYPSASVVKALLLVAYLRREGVRDRPLRADEDRVLGLMIRRSSNRAASEVVSRLGPAWVDRVAHRYGMPSFALAPWWGRSLITAREQSRFMLRVDLRLPSRHRAYGMRLLRTIVPRQRWGIARVPLPGWSLAFKGGWGEGPGRVHHQVALLQRGEERVGVAILTSGQGTHRYGTGTLRGVAWRLLRRLAGPPSA